MSLVMLVVVHASSPSVLRYLFADALFLLQYGEDEVSSGCPGYEKSGDGDGNGKGLIAHRNGDGSWTFKVLK